MKYLAITENADGLNHVVFTDGPSNGGVVLGEIYYPEASFELGASSADPSLGEGQIIAYYTEDTYTNGTAINLGLYIQSKGGDPGSGTGSYEVYLPDYLKPSSDIFAGSFNIWIAGGGVSEFDGSVKWTMRNTDKGPKLIFTVNGQEWGPMWPKRYADFKLRGSIRYYI